MVDSVHVYLAVVLVGLGIAFVEQAFLPGFVSRHTVWGRAPGWQREIAFWNIGLAVVIAGVLWAGDPGCLRIVVAALSILTGLLGTNHLLAARARPNARLHRVGALVNYLAASAGMLVLWR